MGVPLVIQLHNFERKVLHDSLVRHHGRINEVMQESAPTVWAALPVQGKDLVYARVEADIPNVVEKMVRDFQSIIGTEAREQFQGRHNKLPDYITACVGGGSNAMGLFFPFLDDPEVKIIGVEAGGKGVNEKMEHCASLTGGRPGVLHGNRTYLLQDDDGQILEGFSISAGLDYPGIGPEHAWLHDIGRAEYVSITDKEALGAFQLSCALEGIIPALEPSHALAHVMKIAPDLPKDHIIVMNMCGRGDKDIFAVAQHLGFDMG